MKDRAYFGRDGGVTLSGGEALLQDGTIELPRLLKQEGIRDGGRYPAAWCSRTVAGCLAVYGHSALADLKIMNDADHQRWTGRSNAMIRVISALRRFGAKATDGFGLTPIIPGATDSDENIRAIGNRINAIGGANAGSSALSTISVPINMNGSTSTGHSKTPLS